MVTVRYRDPNRDKKLCDSTSDGTDQNQDIFFPITGGCSEGLGAF